ncbi:hypothetical protein [Streptomyces capitiformicae]|uniref:Uncharacterized protein n=1 Tax=Streptomyces capitiformicae TaxID=2014920 RepID=A0A918ZVZ5_9ACTN|nr:hypothetical protein GCM10017771_97120 [Streptomyces capitiformicae]
MTRLPSEIAERLEKLEVGDPAGVMDELDLVIDRLERHFAYEEATLVTALDALGFDPAQRGAPPAG